LSTYIVVSRHRKVKKFFKWFDGATFRRISWLVHLHDHTYGIAFDPPMIRCANVVLYRKKHISSSQEGLLSWKNAYLWTVLDRAAHVDELVLLSHFWKH
jgi:hypothetical protein